MNFCTKCGAPLKQRIPPGDDRLRFVCDSFGTIHYENPRIVVGCIPEWKDSILLCKRAIEPRYGWWTVPAGYLEKGETLLEGAKRETLRLYYRDRPSGVFPSHMGDIPPRHAKRST